MGFKPNFRLYSEKVISGAVAAFIMQFNTLEIPIFVTDGFNELAHRLYLLIPGIPFQDRC